MKSKLSDIASIAEIIGSVAIVVSLIYVGVQVNDSTRAVRSANANDISAAIADWYNVVGSNPQAAYYLSQEGTLDMQIRESLTNNLAGVRE